MIALAFSRYSRRRCSSGLSAATFLCTHGGGSCGSFRVHPRPSVARRGWPPLVRLPCAAAAQSGTEGETGLRFRLGLAARTLSPSPPNLFSSPSRQQAEGTCRPRTIWAENRTKATAK
ncbi:hypothetical protein MRX96_044686 [Rhipicephalus microplus]